MTDATDTPQASQPAAEISIPAADVKPVEAAAPAPAEKESLFAKIRTFVPPRILPIGAAAAFGVLGGVAATSGYYERFEPAPPKHSDIAALGETVRRLETNISALSTTIGTSSKTTSTQFAKLGERIDKVEKSVAEPNSR